MIEITTSAREELQKVLADKGDNATVRIFARHG
jgi:hypothetical protein